MNNSFLKYFKSTTIRYYLVMGLVLLFIFDSCLLYTQEDGTPLDVEIELSERATLINDLSKAINHAKYGDYKQADILFEKIDSNGDIQKDSGLFIKMLNWRAFMNKVINNYSESLSDYFYLLDYYESKNDINGLFRTQSLIAELHRARGEGDLVEKHLGLAEAMIKNEKIDSCNMAYWFSRKAAFASQYLSSKEETEYFIERGLEYANPPCAKYTKALLLNELAYLYGDTKFESEDEIVSLYKESIDILQSQNRQRDITSVVSNLVVYYLRTGNEEAAMKELFPILEKAEKNEWDGILESLYVTQMTILQSQGKFEEAYEVSRKAFNSKIRLMNNQYSVEVEELEAIYEKELAEKALADVEASANFNRQILIYTSIIAVLLFSGMLVIYRLFIRVKGSNATLKIQQDQIAEKNEELSKSIGEKELLYKELNHRVKNNLMVLSSLIYLQQESTETKDEETQYLYQSLRNRIQTMAIVHEKLYGGNVAAHVNLEEYLKELIPLIHSSMHKGRITDFPMKISCSNINLPINQAIPLALIFNELITNSIKHVSEDSLSKGINIQSKHQENLTKIVYSDYGKGVSNILNLDKSKSMGMKIIKLMTQQLRAKIKQLSTNEGLSFEITINHSSN